MLLERLLNAYRVSGREFEIRNIIKEELNKIRCEFEEDLLGNIVITKNKKNVNLMISANMDTNGLIVTYIEEKGAIRVNKIGNVNLNNVVGSIVKFENGVEGIIYAAKENPEISYIYIDLGVDSKEDVNIKEGDSARFISDGFENENYIVNPGLDNAVGCYILLEILKAKRSIKDDVAIVFSTQGVLEGRGARAAAYNCNPNMAIILSGECTGDHIGGKGTVKLNEGPVLRIKDRSLIMCQNTKELLESISEKADIKIQYAVSTESSEGTLHKERCGISTGILGLPIRYRGTLKEMVSKKDIDSMKNLLNELI